MSSDNYKGFVLSPEARQDLIDLWEYVADHDIDAADKVRDEVYSAIQNLVRMPLMGQTREDLHLDKSLRVWVVRSYLIIYRPDPVPLEVVRILSGYRDIAALFSV